MNETEIDLKKLGNLPNIIKYVDYNGEIKEFDPYKALAINSDDIQFEKQAILFYNVVQLSTAVQLQLDNAKAKLEQHKSILYFKFSIDEKLRQLNGNKKPTENMLQSLVNQEDETIKLVAEYNKVKYHYTLLNNLAKAFEQRKDMLQSLSAKKRLEMKTGQNDIPVQDKYTR